jgi:hypothetical protein
MKTLDVQRIEEIRDNLATKANGFNDVCGMEDSYSLASVVSKLPLDIQERILEESPLFLMMHCVGRVDQVTTSFWLTQDGNIELISQGHLDSTRFVLRGE